DQNLLDRLGQTVRNVVALSAAMLTAPVLALTAMTGSAIGAFRLEGQHDPGRLVAEIVVGRDDRYCGKRIPEVLDPHQAAALAHLPRSLPPRFLRDVDTKAALQPGDLLVFCGEPRQLVPLLTDTPDAAAGQGLRWAGWLPRMLRVARRTVAEME